MHSKIVADYIITDNNQIPAKNSLVFRARHIRDGSQAALKVFPLKMDSDRFQAVKKQIQFHQSLSHKHIVKLLRVYETERNLYVATEYCQGKDLHYQLQRQFTIPANTALAYLEGLVEALSYLHALDVSHNNIQLSNVLITKGLAKLTGFRPNADDRESHLLFRSPQSLANKARSPQSDIWSMGICFYAMLVGTLPWVAEDSVEQLQRIVHGDLLIPRRLGRLESVLIRGCLRIRPEERMSLEQIRELIIHTKGERTLGIAPKFGQFRRHYPPSKKQLQEQEAGSQLRLDLQQQEEPSTPFRLFRHEAEESTPKTVEWAKEGPDEDLCSISQVQEVYYRQETLMSAATEKCQTSDRRRQAFKMIQEALSLLG